MRFFSLILLIALLAFSSCKKDWTCTCSLNQTYVNESNQFSQTASGTQIRKLKKMDKKHANAVCGSFSAKRGDGIEVSNTYYDCSLK
jgi:hypothetical protein